MKVAKFLVHLSIDALFKDTFGADIDIFHVTDGPWVPVEWKYGMINPIRVTTADLKNLSGGYDIFVADDPQSFAWLMQSGITPRLTVFYCHGFYSPETDVKTFNFLKGRLGGVPIIYATERHRESMAAWAKHGAHLIAGRALMPQHFMFSEERNGRIMTLGNGVLERFKLYPGYEKSFEVWDMVLDRFADYLDIYGYNDNVPVQFRRGYNPYVMECRYYSVGFYPSPCPVTNQSLMETMAMGIAPVLHFPRYELPKEGNKEFYWLEEDPNWVLGRLEQLRCDPGQATSMGRKAQEFAKEHFDANPWGEKVREFLEGL